jgi:phosphate transport system permease protein
LFTSIILGTGRAIGETIIVLMVCGNIVQIPSSLFDPIRTLPANIALEMDFALGDHRSALFVSGLLLMGVNLVLVLLAEAIAEEDIYHY